MCAKIKGEMEYFYTYIAAPTPNMTLIYFIFMSVCCAN